MNRCLSVPVHGQQEIDPGRSPGQTELAVRPAVEVRAVKVIALKPTVDNLPKGHRADALARAASPRQSDGFDDIQLAASRQREHRHLRAAPVSAHRWHRFEPDSQR